ncbi:MAG: ABC transporter ATP-binding protein [Pseudoxanthomonas suwonensis]|nr:ABC transporter ATP-binding protein [Pseudoxanthomonas suwonensis]
MTPASTTPITSVPLAPTVQPMPDQATPSLALQDIHVAYRTPTGDFLAVDGVSLHLQRGQIGCLLGVSGCGKTTVLRAVAGFEPLLAGRIRIEGETVADTAGGRPPERRRVGMMFQDYALFPHLDVAANVAFGLRSKSGAQRRAKVAEMLALVGLEHAAGKFPHELSGGQQQRVALARALAPDPAVLLLDEPFSNLDVDTRQQLAVELRGLLKRTGTTVLMVTHDQGEAFAMGDVIGVMARGRILQWGDARSLYARPASVEVAGFIGRGSILPARALGLDEDTLVLLRPEQLRLASNGPVCAELLDVGFRGPGLVGSLSLADGGLLEMDLPEGDWQAGQCVHLSLDAPDTLPRFPI